MTPTQALAAELRAEAAESRAYADRLNAVNISGQEQRAQAEAYRDIAARLDALGDGWRGIESAPKDGTWILAFSRCAIIPVVVRWNESVNCWVETKQPSTMATSSRRDGATT